MPRRPKSERTRAPLSAQWAHFARQGQSVTGVIASINVSTEAEKDGALNPYRITSVTFSDRTFPVWVQQGQDLKVGDRVTGMPVMGDLTGRLRPDRSKELMLKAPILANVRSADL